MTASSRDSFDASVARDPSCGASVARPVASSSSTRNTSGAPSSASRSCNSPAVSSSPIVNSVWPSTAPASIRWARRITELPVVVSPLRIAQLIGAAPRWRGRREE
jgi:hypothetical protein